MRLAIVAIFVVLMAGCQEPQAEKEGMVEVTGQHVTELEKTACLAADEAGTCETKLASLGFITKEKCCETFGKCC